MKITGILVFCLIMSLSTLSLSRETSYQAMTGSVLDTNTGFADKDVDKIYNLVSEIQVARIDRIEPAFNLSYLFMSEFNGEFYSNVPLLNQKSVKFSLQRLWQNEFEYTSPFYSAKMGLKYDFVGDDQRNKSVIDGQFLSNRRLNDRIFLTTGVRVKNTNSIWGVQDGLVTRLFAATDLSFRDGQLWYGTLGYSFGDTWSVLQTQYCDGSTATDIWPLILAASDIESDIAFNDAFCGQWFGYRLKGTTIDLTLGFNRPLSQNASLDISWVGVSQQASAGSEYQRHLLRMAILWHW